MSLVFATINYCASYNLTAKCKTKYMTDVSPHLAVAQNTRPLSNVLGEKSSASAPALSALAPANDDVKSAQPPNPSSRKGLYHKTLFFSCFRTSLVYLAVFSVQKFWNNRVLNLLRSKKLLPNQPKNLSPLPSPQKLRTQKLRHH